MAEAFIGLTIRVVLTPPSHATLTGKVVTIQGQTLLLEHVYFHQSGRIQPQWSIPSSEIADLQVVEPTSLPQFARPNSLSSGPGPNIAIIPAAPAPYDYGTSLPIRSTSGMTDPAILSYERPSPIVAKQPPAEISASPVKLSPVEIDDGMPAASIPGEVQQTPVGKPKGAKGWRSTPLLEEATQPAPGQTLETPSRNLTKGKKGAKGKKRAQRAQLQLPQNAQNGWATEDATDVQDLGDFDFEANLSKFDKKTVFDQIRKEDTTADEDRLVSHNRLARPGTYGGKNLHPTEMVLSPPMKPKQDEVESPSDADSEINFGSGRNSRQSQRSRTSSRQPPRRSTSGVHEERSLSRSLRALPSAVNPLSASMMSASSHRSNSSLRNAALRAGSTSSPLRSNFPQQPHFRVRSTQQVCPALLPERLRQLESETMSSIGISIDALTELCARGIAQAMTFSAYRLPLPGRRNSKESVSARPSVSAASGAKPVIVVLAGNHIKGARAIAAVRHLYGRDYKILISVTNYDKPQIWNASVGKQVRILQKIGRKAARTEGWPSTSAQIKKLSAPPTLIVDALLDGTRYGDLQDAQQAIEGREMIDWMNRSRAAVMSIACPSGYDAATGETTVMEGEPLAVKPDRVLALGAPLQGLLEAAQDGEGWMINVLDIGIGPASRTEELVPFGSEWSADVEFVHGVSGGGGNDTH